MSDVITIKNKRFIGNIENGIQSNALGFMWRPGMPRKKIRIEKSSLASVAELIHFTALIEGNEKAIIPAQQSVELIGIIEGLYKSAITRQKINF